jgi:putative ABC transport system permease protein
VLFGLLPAFLDLLRHGQVLTEGNVRGTSGTPLSRHMRALLLLSEVALAVMLLIGAGLVVKSLYRLQRVDTGFVADNVLRMRVSFPAAKARDPERVIQFFQQTVSAVEQLNGVRAAGAVLCPPLGGGCWEAVFGVEGQTAITRAQVPSARFNSVAGNYFGAIGTRLLKGRTFTDTDYQQRRPLVVVNKSLANRFWGNVDPIGRRIKIGWPPTGPNPWLEVVGVVDDSKRDTLAEPGQMEAFVMHPTAPRPFLDLIVRTDVPPMSLARTVRDTVWRFDKDAMLFNVGTMEDSLSKSLTPQRFPALLVSLFAGLALLLATAGIYSVVAFAVTQQLGEIAIRLALGAGRQQLLFAVGRQALFAIGIGVVVGLGGAWGFSRMLSGLLFEVPVVDSVTFIFVPLLVLAVALVATFVPALRALRVDAAAVLRTL